MTRDYHPIQATSDTDATQTQAPERITEPYHKLPGGYYCTSYMLYHPHGKQCNDWTRDMWANFAAAMQPVPSENDEAVAREIMELVQEDGLSYMRPKNAREIAAILARHRKPAPAAADNRSDEEITEGAMRAIDSHQTQVKAHAAAAAEAKALRAALRDSNSLFAAMYHEQRPWSEIEKQINDNNEALATRASVPSAWQPIDTAPAASGFRDKEVWVYGGSYTKPTLTKPDGYYWRSQFNDEYAKSRIPTHWMSQYEPTAPTGEA